mmetsp:Transcript_63333/g.187169  ORF Transcript_63333/g.187169 Transcript_63333/m.187169 type:complete len:90 (-) Transcript_63333:667-936(-)
MARLSADRPRLRLPLTGAGGTGISEDGGSECDGRQLLSVASTAAGISPGNSEATAAAANFSLRGGYWLSMGHYFGSYGRRRPPPPPRPR